MACACSVVVVLLDELDQSLVYPWEENQINEDSKGVHH